MTQTRRGFLGTLLSLSGLALAGRRLVSRSPDAEEQVTDIAFVWDDGRCTCGSSDGWHEMDCLVDA